MKGWKDGDEGCNEGGDAISVVVMMTNRQLQL